MPKKNPAWRRVKFAAPPKNRRRTLWDVLVNRMLDRMARRNGVDWSKGTVRDDSPLARLIAGDEDR